MSGEVENIIGRELKAWEVALLQEAELYLVGGVVRDLLRGDYKSSLDQDYIVRGISLDSLDSVLSNYGKTNLVGKSFGVIKFVDRAGNTVDISLPRTEYSTGSGHRDFNVKYDQNLPVEEDLKRRDFTINSIALNMKTGEFVDPLGGKSDLKRRLLRVNSGNSFLEDPLRILRGIQFMTRFLLKIETQTRELMWKYSGMMDKVAPERIRDELTKMMQLGEKPGDGFEIMHRTGMLEYIIPELEETYGIEQNEYHCEDLFFHSINSCNKARKDLEIRWSALLHDIGKKETRMEKNGRIVFYRHEEVSADSAGRILRRLRYPNTMIKKVTHLIRQHMFHITEEFSDSAVRRFIHRAGVENLDDLFALRKADIASRNQPWMYENLERTRERVERILEEESAFSITDLAISGNDVKIIVGLKEGPEIGRILDRIMEMVIENPALNRREKLIDLLKSIRDERGKFLR